MLQNNFTQNNTLIPSPLGVPQVRNMLGLNQIEGFKPVEKFTDDLNTHWTLVKSSADSTVDVPDPKSLQIIDYWNHEFPNLRSKLYVYVVEGIRQPRVETEQAARILYQWFSTVLVPTFSPQMITDREWLKANVYAAPLVNSRVSKLKAICKIDSDLPTSSTDDKLIKVEELTNEHNEGNRESSE